MPTYTVKFSNFDLNTNNKKKLALAITKVHNKITGANLFFAQVIFQKNKKNYHFIGGRLAKDKQVFLQGQIRAGRSKQVKKKLIENLRDAIKKNISINKDNIWVYILDLLPEQMIEYGEILPQSGKEKLWFKSLPKKLQKKLKKIEKT